MTSGPVSKNIQKLFFYEEPDRASYGVDHSGTLGDYTLIPHIEGSIDFDAGIMGVDPGQGVHHVHDWRKEIHSHKVWTLTFQTPLAPTGTLAGDGVAAVQGACSELLALAMGGVILGTGTTASGAWGADNSGDVASAGNFAPGMAIAHESGGRLYARELKEVSGTTLTTKVDLPAAPADTDPIYAAASHYLDPNRRKFGQFLVMGEEEDDRWILCGGSVRLTGIELPLTGEGVPLLTFECEGRIWLYGEDGATDLSLESFTPEAYTNYAPIAADEGDFVEQAVGTTDDNCIPVKEMNFELSTTDRAITSPCADEGILYYQRVRQNEPTIQGSFMPSFFEDLTRSKRRDNRDDVYLAYAFGKTTTSGVVLITASCVQYTDAQNGESEDVGVETITWKGRNDTDTVEATATDLGLSCFRIHIFG